VINTVLCHPPEDVDPTPDEVNACGSYLDVQIAVVQPRVIVTLGATQSPLWWTERLLRSPRD